MIDTNGDIGDGLPPRLIRVPSPFELLDRTIDDAETTQLMANRLAARQIFTVRDAFDAALASPRVYVPVGASTIPGVEDLDFARRSIAFDLAQRLHLSENVVRDYDYQARVLDSSLPHIRDLFTEGIISHRHVKAAVENTTGVPAEALERYDERLAAIAAGLRPDVFARRCRLVRERLSIDSLQERHDRERAKRRVVIEPVNDGMAWISAYVPLADAARADARLSATATRMRKESGEARTKAQLRADAFIAWLCGDGTPTAATAHPFVLIDGGGRFAEVLGYGPIDPRTAAASLHDAPSFRRVVEDPVRPARLVLDKGQYRPSADQRTWLRLNYGLDDAAAPFVSPDAEIDHVIEFQYGGVTDVANLVPLKPRLHRLKSATRIRLDPKPNGGIRVRTPTRYDSDPPPF